MELKPIVGEIAASDTGRIKKARIHQGWWRAFVLKQEQGRRPNSKDKKICSTVPDYDGYLGNFITPEIGQLALDVAAIHNDPSRKSAGIIQIDRLKNNLLSSQPLCFNFFGMLAFDHKFALEVIQQFFPEITNFREVKFEFAPTPKTKFTGDNSAYDVALEVEIDGKIGLIGIECKYTESFSPKEYRSERYKKLYDVSRNFVGSYQELTTSRFNQLFRNQMIAESLLQNNVYSFVKTALFCDDEDKSAQATAQDFGALLRSKFTTITFMDLITAMQRCEISVEQRKNTMMLWTRYSAYELSEQVYVEY